eukprot:PhF_6_TR628/c1_g1_i1/m.845/K15104/SLC25A11, OGC; solute carrier family 25 (mitochondrial oxoglutarate transporter), member 11
MYCIWIAISLVMTATMISAIQNTNTTSASSSSVSSPPLQPYPSWYTFLFSALGGAIAWVVIHPMDIVKTKMQLQQKGSSSSERNGVTGAIRSILKEKGVQGLYEGLSAGVMRQFVYATSRLGLYNVFRDAIAEYLGSGASLGVRILAGALSGAVAAYITGPVEIALVRIQMDSVLPAKQRRGYTGPINALVRIAREEGVRTYWRGCIPTVIRAMAVGITQVCFYDQCKQVLIGTGLFLPDSYATFTTTSMITGVVYSFLTMPLETIKIRMQTQQKQANGKFKYTGMVSALWSVVTEEGVGALYRGYFPYYLRCAVHTVVCFFVVEQLVILATWIHGY